MTTHRARHEIPHRHAALALAALLLLLPAAARGGEVSEGLRAIMDGTDDGTRIPVMIEMAEQLDVDAVVESLETKAERVPALVEALKALAARSQNAGGCQAGILAELAAQGTARAANVRPFWVRNAVAVEATKDVVTGCAARADVAMIDYDGMNARQGATATPAAPFDALAAIGAPAAQVLGAGAGAVVGLIDTGADATHPALRDNVLTRADGTPLWRDAVAGAAAPYDDHGEGTHLLGIAVGRTVGGTPIGVAPDARWVACKGIGLAGGTIQESQSRLQACFEFMLNPDDPDPVDPAHVPDVVLAPWWIDDPGVCDSFFADHVRVLRAAGILPVFAVGHDTVVPGADAPPDALPYPPSFPETLAVGASSDADPASLLSTSYRGIADCRKPGETAPPVRAGRPAPQVFAPGVNVRSAWPGGGYAILDGNPEGVAAAQVAGAAALLLSVAPTLNPAQVEDALERTALGYAPAASDPSSPEALLSYRPGLLDVFAAATFQEATFTPPQTPPPAGSVTDSQVVASVTFANTGVTTWQPGACRLVALAPVWGEDVFDLAAPVLPGKLASFDMNLVVPHVPGTYGFRWQVQCGGGTIGPPSPNVDVAVEGTDLAVYLGRQPDAMPPGTNASAFIGFRNAGTSTWTPGRYAVVEVDGTHWARAPSLLFPDVPPGGDGWFYVPIVAPSLPGTYDFQWVMTRDGVSLGIYSANDRVRVEGTKDAQFAGWTPPPWEMRPGTPALVEVDFYNNGSHPWLPGYCMKVREAGFWSASDVCLGPMDMVPPGGLRRFQTVIVAPDGRQRAPFDVQMFDDQGAPFGQVASTSVGIPWVLPAVSWWDVAPGVQGAGRWFFRILYGWLGWYKLGWNGTYWSYGAPYVGIGRTWAHPGVVGRFWKSPVAGWVRARASVHRLNPNACGDGVTVALAHGTAAPSAILTIPRNDWTSYEIGPTSFFVQVNDTIRFQVHQRANIDCDNTYLEAVIEVLAPGTVGPIPSPQPVDDPDFEPAG